MTSCWELFRSQIQETVFLQHVEYDIIGRMTTLFFTSETQPCKPEFLLFDSCISFCSCKCSGRIVFPVGFDFHFITDKSLGFENQSLQGCSVAWFNCMGCRSGCNCASVGVCPRWQAANASLASDVIPFVSKALASACDSATSSALLFRAFTDSKEVPIAKLNRKGLRMKRINLFLKTQKT